MNNSSKLTNDNYQIITFGCRLNIVESQIIADKINKIANANQLACVEVTHSDVTRSMIG